MLSTSTVIGRAGATAVGIAAVAFFAAEDAGYITSQVLGVNGGTAV